MLFNSFQFPVFLAIVFCLYWFVFQKNIKGQNILILVASYVFYGFWDWRFVGLIFLSSVTDYLIGQGLSKEKRESKRKMLMGISLLVNLGMLCFFKYFNFFIDSFIDLFSIFGYTMQSRSLEILLPVGISFYTFQTLSYTLDVYRGRIEATKDPISFFAFVSFFPQLVAGPIERASNLLPQFLMSRKFDLELAKDGLRQMILGLAKKLIIADSCGVIVNEIFGTYTDQSSTLLIIGAIFFAIQIYGDFSGYSDIAIGTAKLFGFRLMDNFKTPYFAVSIADLWRRWHISLSQWANTYIFIPLSMRYSKLKAKGVVMSLMVTFTIIGLWHGANWTFVVFGLWHGLVSAIEYLTTKKRRTLKKKTHKGMFTFVGWFITMMVWLVGMIIFRAESIGVAFDYMGSIFSNNLIFEIPRLGILEVGLYAAIFFLCEWIQRNKDHMMQIENLHIAIRWSIYIFLMVISINGLFGGSEEFIYFQF